MVLRGAKSKNVTMFQLSMELALRGKRDPFDRDKNGQQNNARFQSFTPFSTSMLLTVYYQLRDTAYMFHSFPV